MPVDDPTNASSPTVSSRPTYVPKRLSVKQAAEIARDRSRRRQEDQDAANKRPRQSTPTPEPPSPAPTPPPPPPIDTSGDVNMSEQPTAEQQDGTTTIDKADLNDAWKSYAPDQARVWFPNGVRDLFDRLLVAQSNDWNKYAQTNPGRSLFLLTIDEPAPSTIGEHQVRARQLTTALSDLLIRLVENPATVIASIPAPNKSSFNIYFIKDLEIPERNALVDRTFARQRHTTMHFASPDNRFSDKRVFIGGFKGFDDPRVAHNNPEGSLAVRNHIICRILETPIILSYINKRLDKDEACAEIKAGISFRAMRVRTGPTSSAIHYAAWITTPFETQALTLPFIASLRNDLKAKYFLLHPDFGNGEYVEKWLCERCPSADHYQPNCPFPALEGWPGKPPIQVTYEAPPQQPDVQRDPIFGITDNTTNPNDGVWSYAGRGRGRGRGRGNRNSPYPRGGGDASRGGRGRGRGRGF